MYCTQCAHATPKTMIAIYLAKMECEYNSMSVLKSNGGSMWNEAFIPSFNEFNANRCGDCVVHTHTHTTNRAGFCVTY